MAVYTIFVMVNGNWEVAKEATMSKSAAHGLFRQFVQGGFQTRLFRGATVGKKILVAKTIKK